MGHIKHPFTTLLITAFLSTESWAKTIDITNITETIVAQDGDILTGRRTLEAKISIADGATVTLQNFTHYDAYTTNIKPEPGITCEGNATIILKNENIIESTKEYPGIFVPENKTLTINGQGEPMQMATPVPRLEVLPTENRAILLSTGEQLTLQELAARVSDVEVMVAKNFAEILPLTEAQSQQLKAKVQIVDNIYRHR